MLKNISRLALTTTTNNTGGNMKNFDNKPEVLFVKFMVAIALFISFTLVSIKMSKVCDDVETIKQQLEAPITINNKDIQTIKDLCKSVRTN
jgi:cell division protein FtsL